MDDPDDALLDGPLEGECQATVNLLDVYVTIRRIAGSDATESEGHSLVLALTGRLTYLAEYRGHFAESLERVRTNGPGRKRFDRDSFALVETGYYGDEDSGR